LAGVSATSKVVPSSVSSRNPQPVTLELSLDSPQGRLNLMIVDHLLGDTGQP